VEEIGADEPDEARRFHIREHIVSTETTLPRAA
jgi:hypothetical protein